MSNLVQYIGLLAVIGLAVGHYQNETGTDPADAQLETFRRRHPERLGVNTRLSGAPLDVRDTVVINSDLFNHRNHFTLTGHNTRERTPERTVFAKGYGAFGYFELTHNVSKYVKSDVFNGVGKKTPIVARFSTTLQSLGGSDLTRERKGMSIKMYTHQGNMDFVCSNDPVFSFKDPMYFRNALHAFRRNPRTDIFDNTARWDFATLRPSMLETMLWSGSDFSLPDGYRRMNFYPIHTYILYNTRGEKYYVKFIFTTEQKIKYLSDARAKALAADRPDYFHRDLFNAISLKKYPSWKVDMHILTEGDLLKVDYDPFDVTRRWRQGTFHTVPLGRIVLNTLIDNHFHNIEGTAFSVDNLVPGVFGPVDSLYRARKIMYPDAQNYRLGSNYNKAIMNAPILINTYNRDGIYPTLNNMKGAPNYFPNSFNGPMPYVDEQRPFENIEVYQSKAVDLGPLAEFYNEVVESDAHRQRIANFLASTMRTIPWDIEKKSLRLLSQISQDLGKRVRLALERVRAVNIGERRNQTAHCIAEATRLNIDEELHHRHHLYSGDRHMSFYH